MIAVVCPGQGSQKPGFLAPWLEVEGVEEQLTKLSTAAELDLIHFGTEADEETIKDTAVAQPLIVAAGIVAGTMLLRSDSFDPAHTVFAGHSVGEVTAASLTGVLTEEEAMQFIRVRATGMAQAAAVAPSGMSAVLGGIEDDVRAAISDGGLTAANSNGGGQIVVAGSLEHLKTFAENPPAKTRVIPLKVAGAFHTDFMKDAQEPLQDFAQALQPQNPQATLLTNFDGSQITTGSAVLESLVAQVVRPVRWDLCMQTMGKLNVETIIELTPSGTLVGLAKRALKGKKGIALNVPEDLLKATAVYSAS